MLWYHHCVSLFWIYYLKSIPHRAVNALLFSCRCCYSCWCFLRGVWLCLFDFQFFILFFLSSLLVFLWWSALCLVATLGGCTLSWDCFDWFFVLITGITHTSFVVPRKLLSSFVPPHCCSFFLWLMPSTCVVGSFRRLCGTILNLERIIVSKFLDLQLETLCDCRGTFFACLFASALLWAYYCFGRWL